MLEKYKSQDFLYMAEPKVNPSTNNFGSIELNKIVPEHHSRKDYL